MFNNQNLTDVLEKKAIFSDIIPTEVILIMQNLLTGKEIITSTST
jgi:hypothetical protein